MRAEGVEHMRLAALAAEEHHIAPKIFDGLDLVRAELASGLDNKPTSRITSERHDLTPDSAASPEPAFAAPASFSAHV